LASIDRTAYPRFKRVISARELAESFTPAPGEVEWARGRTQNDQHFLALVVRLKCYQRLGYFPKLAEVPVMVVDHVRGKLELARDVAAVADAECTGKRHRQFVRDRLGVKYAPAAVREVAETAIRTAVQCKDNPADLINAALDELVRQRVRQAGCGGILGRRAGRRGGRLAGGHLGEQPLAESRYIQAPSEHAWRLPGTLPRRLITERDWCCWLAGD
jgi:hypothetical protein